MYGQVLLSQFIQIDLTVHVVKNHVVTGCHQP